MPLYPDYQRYLIELRKPTQVSQMTGDALDSLPREIVLQLLITLGYWLVIALTRIYLAETIASLGWANFTSVLFLTALYKPLLYSLTMVHYRGATRQSNDLSDSTYWVAHAGVVVPLYLMELALVSTMLVLLHPYLSGIVSMALLMGIQAYFMLAFLFAVLYEFGVARSLVAAGIFFRARPFQVVKLCLFQLFFIWAGVVFCGIGVLFTFPVAWAMHYTNFEEYALFTKSAATELDLLEHLVE